MRGFIFLSAFIFASATAVAGAPEDEILQLDSVVVSSTRADKKSPVTYSFIGKDELRAAPATASVPMVLELQPSVVTYNEGGNGLGYSWMTIRGSKGSQINVTLNGVTLNDAESQEVFWVNIPALSSLISSVQLQRGLGTTAGGSGAFGASVNMSTASVGSDEFKFVELSSGSWSTLLRTVSYGSGLTKNGFYFNSAVSKGRTDGYIRRGKVKSLSAFISAGWLGGNNSVKLTWLLGDQRSGITWDGISPEQYKEDRRQNNAGAYTDSFGNTRYYDNQIDRYRQHHIQLNWTHDFGGGLTWSNTLNYTRGDGYDEYYGARDATFFGAFGFPEEMTGQDGLPYVNSDMIYRKKMGNDFYLAKTDVSWKSSRLSLTGGVSISKYIGDQWGDVLWSDVLGDAWDYKSFNSAKTWYSHKGKKWEGSAYLRAEYSVMDAVTAYADLQFRRIDYSLKGRDEDFPSTGAMMDFTRKWTFLNPRGGLAWEISPEHRVYGSVSVGHREPGRGDIKENIKGSINHIRPERMTDIELGYSFKGKEFSASATVYLMEYRDILLETGKLSPEGYALKENLPEGYRRGIEVAAAWQPCKGLRLDANATLSTNKIKDYTAWIPYSDYSGQASVHYGKTDMLLSPSLLGMMRASVQPFEDGISLSLSAKYVGKQYIDNTMRSLMKIPARCTMDLSLSKKYMLRGNTIEVTGYIYNLLNHKYFASGWRYETVDPATGEIQSFIGIYPQATINWSVKVSYTF